MSESIEKQLLTVFAQAWNDTVSARLGDPTELTLLALRQVSGDEMNGALAVAMTWSAAFVAECTAALPGVLICLFKSEDNAELDSRAKQPTDGAPKPGTRALVDSVLSETATRLAALASMPISFGASAYIDLALSDERLKMIVGAEAWVGTLSLTVGDDLMTQALLLYAPQGSLGTSANAAESASTSRSTATNNAPATTDTPHTPPNENSTVTSSPSSSSAPTPSRRAPNRREEPAPRNIERLLDVDLDIIVRFGVTNMPLRDVVRMGVGTMIELNRAVDEPVELLVNNRPLARGEVVVVDGYYGVRITEIGTPAERALSLV